MILYGFMVVHACIFISFFLAHNTPILTTPQLSFWQETRFKIPQTGQADVPHLCCLPGCVLHNLTKAPFAQFGVTNKLLHSVKLKKWSETLFLNSYVNDGICISAALP